MAKTSTINIKLVSTAKTGYYYTTSKNGKNPKKMEMKKYDPVIRKHIKFVESKLR